MSLVFEVIVRLVLQVVFVRVTGGSWSDILFILHMCGHLLIYRVFAKLVLHVIEDTDSADLNQRIVVSTTPYKDHILLIKVLEYFIAHNVVNLFPLTSFHFGFVEIDVSFGSALIITKVIVNSVANSLQSIHLHTPNEAI